MALDLESQGQLSLLEQGAWQTTMRVEPNHRLVMLCKTIPWEDLMEKAKPILYDEQGISSEIGRHLNLRAHLGIYILQTVYNWTDRWAEEMLRFYFPARIFCGFLDSTGSIDRTRIEDFRNRFGEKGAQLITHDMVKVAKEFGFTKGDDIDMDTTVQEAGITHPTEMKLMSRLMKKAKTVHNKLKEAGKRGLKAMKAIAKQFSRLETDYRFYAKTKEKKDKIIRQAVRLSEQLLSELSNLVPGTKSFEGLGHRYQQDILKLLDLGPRLRMGISVASSASVRPSSRKLRSRPRNVGATKLGTMPKCRNQKDWHSAQRQNKGTCQSTGPANIIKSSSGYRTTHRPSQNSWSGTKPNEERCWRSNLRVSSCAFLQFDPLDERLKPPTGCWHRPKMLENHKQFRPCPNNTLCY